MLKLLVLLMTCASLHAALSQDIRFRNPPLPPGTIPKAALTNAQQAIQAIVAPGVARAIQTSESHAEGIAYYFRSIGAVFCGMSTNANFSAEYLSAEVDKLPAPLAPDTYFLDVRASIVSQYKLVYADRTRAELPPIEWLSKISETFCSSIKAGIQQGGKGNIWQ